MTFKSNILKCRNQPEDNLYLLLCQVGEEGRSTIREQLRGNSMPTDDLLHKQPGYGQGHLVRTVNTSGHQLQPNEMAL